MSRAALAAVVLAGCGRIGFGGDAPTLRVEPEVVSLTVVNGAASSQQLTVYEHTVGGYEEDITAGVELTLGAAVATIEGSVLPSQLTGLNFYAQWSLTP